MRWSKVREVGNSKIVRQSYIWIFLVPFLISAMSHSSLSYPAFGVIVDSFPGSWALLYFSAVFFAVGVSFYLFFCPSMIREYRDYSEFEATGATYDRINIYLKDLCSLGISGNSSLDRIRELSGECSTMDIDEGRFVLVDVPSHCRQYNLKERDVREVFWLVYDQLDDSGVLPQACSYISFGIGFLLLFVLFIQNFVSVTLAFLSS